MTAVTDRPRYERWVLIAAIVASSMAFIDGTALDVATPALQADLRVTGNDLFWISNAYALFLASLILVGGGLGDVYGRKRVFMAGIALFTLASLACGFAPNVQVLIVARAVQGIGGALMTPGSLALISATFPDERRGAAIGAWSTFSTLTTIAGPVLGGVLASAGLWRAVFWINLPLGLLALWLLSRPGVPESRDESKTRLDVPGAILITLSLALLTVGLTAAPGAAADDPTWLLVIGGVIALGLFIVVEARSSHPMMPLTLFQSRTFTGSNLLTLLLYGALRIAPYFLILNILQVQGYPESVAGLTFLPLTFGLVLLSRWSGGMVAKVGARPLLTIGPAIAGLGFLLLGLPGVTGGVADYWVTYFPGALVLGIGMGITVAPLTTAVMNAAPRANVGAASGTNNAVARVAAVLALAIAGGWALSAFRANLEVRVPVDLSAEARAALLEGAAAFGATEAPPGLTAPQTEAVTLAIRESFVGVYQQIALASALLAWGAALCAWLTIRPRQPA